MRKADLLARIIEDCRESGVNLQLHKQPHLWFDTVKISGYFSDEESEDTPALVVAGGRPDWDLILFHEYSHMCQWKDGLFDHHSFGYEAYNVFDQWLTGDAEYDSEVVEAAVRGLQFIELDAEQRTVELIKKYNVKTSIREYIKRANTYVLSYEVMRRTRRWTNKARPYDIPEITNLVSSSTFVQRLDILPSSFEGLVVDLCMNPVEKDNDNDG